MPVAFRPGDSPRCFGYHFLIGLQPSPRITDHDRRLLDAVGPAGVVLFRDNFQHGVPYEEWLDTLRQLLADVRQLIGREEILVAIDHEGGRVHRPPPPITHLPPAVDWGDRAQAMARVMGAELRSLGFNLNFAPVADVGGGSANGVIGDRAFSSVVGAVCDSVGAVIRGLEEEAVWACPKHYPGHGGTPADSHLELPVIAAGLEELRGGPLRPFAAAVDAGARCLMSAHLSFPEIDPGRPSTLSAVLLRRVLREELGFAGLLITDDLGMHAVSETFLAGEAVAETLEATTDLLTVCAHWTDTRRVVGMARTISRSLRRGRLSEETLRRSHGRIRSALERAPRHPVTALPQPLLRQHAAFQRPAAPGRAPQGTPDPTSRRDPR